MSPYGNCVIALLELALARAEPGQPDPVDPETRKIASDLIPIFFELYKRTANAERLASLVDSLSTLKIDSSAISPAATGQPGGNRDTARGLIEVSGDGTQTADHHGKSSSQSTLAVAPTDIGITTIDPRLLIRSNDPLENEIRNLSLDSGPSIQQSQAPQPDLRDSLHSACGLEGSGDRTLGSSVSPSQDASRLDELDLHSIITEISPRLGVMNLQHSASLH